MSTSNRNMMYVGIVVVIALIAGYWWMNQSAQEPEPGPGTQTEPIFYRSTWAWPTRIDPAVGSDG